MVRPFKILIILLTSFIINNERGWVHPQTGWEVITNETMAFYLVNSAYIDNEELEDSQNDVIGVFFGEQNIGWEFYSAQITIIPTSGDNGSLPGYPTDGDPVTFKIYDASENLIIDAIAAHDIPVWESHNFSSVPEIYSCTSDFPILEDGTCIVNCMGDPNLDGQITILDLLEIIDLIITCENLQDCFSNSLECSDYNNDQIIDIIDVILIVNMIL